MADEALADQPLGDVSQQIKQRQVSVVEVVDANLARISRLGAACNSLITVTASRAREQAHALDHLLAGGVHLGPLHGIPITLKDNIASAGIRTTAGSEILKEWIPTKNATVLDRLTAAGAVLVAKANLYEFAFGAPHKLYGPTKNPWNLTHGCGGSSSGSASAVAAGFGYGSVGTDTGGSIRIPAAFCGVVGFKPTYGRVSRAGVIPLSTNMDHVGPIARTVTDAAMLLEAMSGPDGADPTAIRRAAPHYTTQLESGVRGLRLGVLAPQPTERLQVEVRRALLDAYHVLEEAGADLTELHLPDLTEIRAACWTIMRAEAAEYHRPYLRSTPHLYHPTVRDLIEGGEFIPATEYVHAQRVRRKAIADVQSALRTVDALLLPGVAMAAYPIGQKNVDLDGYEEDVLGAMTRYTPLFNLTGHPALVLPCGFSSAGMPVALQVVGRYFDESMVLRVARCYESLTEWHNRRPPVTTPDLETSHSGE